MYRRRVEHSGSDPNLLASAAGGLSLSSLNNNNNSKAKFKKSGDRRAGGLGGTIFLIVVVLLSTFVLRLTYNVLFPSSSSEEPLKETVHDFRNVADKAFEAERDLENKMFHYLQHDKEHDQPKVVPQQEQENDVIDENGHNAATRRMLEQSSTWVDGEKKLKKKLKKLVDEQAKNVNVGVPVLTRYLGEDIPAYVPQGGDVDEWKRQVEEKYAEMREEEKVWQERATEFMKKQEGISIEL